MQLHSCSSAQASQSTSSVSNTYSNVSSRINANRFGSSSDSNSSNSNTTVYRNTSVYRRPPGAPPVRKELAPIKDSKYEIFSSSVPAYYYYVHGSDQTWIDFKFADNVDHTQI
jgi:hypothetical protein